MRHTALLLAVLVAAAPVPADAQTYEEQIVDVAAGLFRAMQHKDAPAIRRLLLPDARLLGVNYQGGSPTGRSVEEFIEAITGTDVEFLERMWNPEVRIDGPIASLWTEYDFHRDGEFSHCGIDAFHLVRVEGEWKIAAITWTMRPEGCYSPLGALGR